jgi:diguanylate cyclase (GGDEF)-like protein/PAS domain S-box-containing protein
MTFRLSTKLILGIVLIEAVMLGLLVWNSVRLIDTSHTELMKRFVQEEVTLLEHALIPGLAAQDRAVLLDTLSLLKNNQDIDYANVYNRQGSLLASLKDGAPRANQGSATSDTLAQAISADGVLDIDRRIELAGQPLGSLRVGYSLSAIQQITASTRLQNTTIAIATLLLLVAATALTGFYLIRRIRQLQAGAQALSSGALDYRIAVKGDDELSDLAINFNHMAQNLQETQHALRLEHSALEREKNRLSTLLNSVDAIVFEGDPSSCQFLYVSSEAENMLGHKAEDWLQADFWNTYVHPDDRDKVTSIATHQVEPGNSYTVDYRMRHRDGDFRWLRSINSVELADNNKPIVRGLLIDIMDQKKSEEKIIYLADHDALTGLLNRRRFQEELEQHTALATRYGYEGGLLFVDLDQFKYINDTLGHQAGDEYLASVSQCLATSLREVDILGRLGGDEFGIIVPQSHERELELVAQKILEALSHFELMSSEISAHVSASIGIAIFPRHGDKPGELLAKADAPTRPCTRSRQKGVTAITCMMKMIAT